MLRLVQRALFHQIKLQSSIFSEYLRILVTSRDHPSLCLLSDYAREKRFAAKVSKTVYSQSTGMTEHITLLCSKVSMSKQSEECPLLTFWKEGVLKSGQVSISKRLSQFHTSRQALPSAIKYESFAGLWFLTVNVTVGDIRF